jgi:hypothetical protein
MAHIFVYFRSRYETIIANLMTLQILNVSRVKCKVKVKLSLCLTKHHAMKAYWGVEI